jgi:hypothetical protein
MELPMGNIYMKSEFVYVNEKYWLLVPIFQQIRESKTQIWFWVSMRHVYQVQGWELIYVTFLAVSYT